MSFVLGDYVHFILGCQEFYSVCQLLDSTCFLEGERRNLLEIYNVLIWKAE